MVFLVLHYLRDMLPWRPLTDVSQCKAARKRRKACVEDVALPLLPVSSEFIPVIDGLRCSKKSEQGQVC